MEAGYERRDFIPALHLELIPVEQSKKKNTINKYIELSMKHIQYRFSYSDWYEGSGMTTTFQIRFPGYPARNHLR